MAENEQLTLGDFTDVTEHIDKALEKINKIYTSSALTEDQKSRLGKLGRAIFSVSHDIGHLFMSLEALPDELKEGLHKHYSH